MDEAIRDRILKEQRALLLGASDMRQAAAAARALEHEEDVDLARALETAMMVCFMRPFTRSDLQVRDELWPTGEDRKRLDEIKRHRDKIYAHTDKESGRWAMSAFVTVNDNDSEIAIREDWYPMSRDVVPDFVALCKRVEDGLLHAAGGLQLVLDGHEALPDS